MTLARRWQAGANAARFTGGVQLPVSCVPAGAVHRVAVPGCLQIPLPRGLHSAERLLVHSGSQVARGQLLTDITGTDEVPVHAPTSGTVRGARSLPCDTHRAFDKVLDLDADGEDRWHDDLPALEDFRTTDPAALGRFLSDQGIVGLGGANYATAAKLRAGRRGAVHTLIINAAECEPFVSCDEALLLNHMQDVLRGCDVLLHATGATRCLFAIEAARVAAIAALRHASATRPRPIHIRLLEARYPSGGERQLVEAVADIEVPSGAYPTDIGFICFNVATARAVADAVRGEPLTSRIVTVGGDAIATAGNFEVRIGTPLAVLIAAAGGYRHPPLRVIDGGPMMGRALPSIDVPVSRASTCLIALDAPNASAVNNARPCIRCARCADVCPVRLQPQQLYAATRAGQFEKAHHLEDCIECGCCAYVCPSNISLVQHFVNAKRQLQRSYHERETAAHARERFEARQQRLARAQQQREMRMASKVAGSDPDSSRAELKESARAAVERAKRKRQARRAESDQHDS